MSTSQRRPVLTIVCGLAEATGFPLVVRSVPLTQDRRSSRTFSVFSSGSGLITVFERGRELFALLSMPARPYGLRGTACGAPFGVLPAAKRRLFPLTFLHLHPYRPRRSTQKKPPGAMFRAARETEKGDFLRSPRIFWWSWGELNSRPLECHSSALPTELQPLRTRWILPKTAHFVNEKFLTFPKNFSESDGLLIQRLTFRPPASP